MVTGILDQIIAAAEEGKLFQLELGGSAISINLHQDNCAIDFYASVYRGGNFIPQSVRQGITGSLPFESWLHDTTLYIDEERAEVILCYSADLTGINELQLKAIVEEFSWQAEEWRWLLDEHDRNDLVPVSYKNR